ncbi:MAG: tRNA pseudouridine(38-40) synthase TruA [Acidimicrobiales bacterium]
MTLFDLGADPEGAAEASPDLRTGPGSAAVRLALLVAYDGAGFRGFALQAGQRTVAGELAKAIATVVRHDVELTCAGRTDAGVHATGQVVHVDVDPGVDLKRLVKGVNAMLGPTVVIRRALVAPPGFDARRSALARHYRYLVIEAATPSPLAAPLAWHVDERLDLRSMAAGADALLGEHDFRAFCRRAPGTAPSDPIMRRVLDARWAEVPGFDGGGPAAYAASAASAASAGGGAERMLRFDIVATSFCHQMVRSVVGALVEVGRQRRSAADITALLRAGRRSSGVPLAPPEGLCLVDVDYGGLLDVASPGALNGTADGSATGAGGRVAPQARRP